MENNNFCYWQEEPPVSIPLYKSKICLLRQIEYKLNKELGINKDINIFCPLINAEQAIEMDCITGIKLNE